MTTSIWRPSTSFLRSGNTKTHIPWLLNDTHIEWSFQKMRKNIPACQFVQCNMRGMGISVRGFGYNFSLKKASIISLAEAWERMIFQSYGKQMESLVQVRYRTSGYAAGRSVSEAIVSAESEYHERYLLCLATVESSQPEPFEIRGPLNLILRSYIERCFGPLRTFIFKHLEWGSLLIAWVETKEGTLYDSIYLRPTVPENTLVRKILLSLIASTQSRNNTASEVGSFVHPEHISLRTPLSLETKVLYTGGTLPPVAVAFDPTSVRPYLNEFSQDRLFAQLIPSMHNKSTK